MNYKKEPTNWHMPKKQDGKIRFMLFGLFIQKVLGGARKKVAAVFGAFVALMILLVWGTVGVFTAAVPAAEVYAGAQKEYESGYPKSIDTQQVVITEGIDKPELVQLIFDTDIQDALATPGRVDSLTITGNQAIVSSNKSQIQDIGLRKEFDQAHDLAALYPEYTDGFFVNETEQAALFAIPGDLTPLSNTKEKYVFTTEKVDNLRQEYTFTKEGRLLSRTVFVTYQGQEYEMSVITYQA